MNRTPLTNPPRPGDQHKNPPSPPDAPSLHHQPQHQDPPAARPDRRPLAKGYPGDMSAAGLPDRSPVEAPERAADDSGGL